LVDNAESRVRQSGFDFGDPARQRFAACCFFLFSSKGSADPGATKSTTVELERLFGGRLGPSLAHPPRSPKSAFLPR